MDDFLTPVSTTSLKRPTESKPITVIEETASSNKRIQDVDLEAPEAVSRALKEQPDADTLENMLESLINYQKDDFILVVPSPIQAQIINTLVNTTIPDYWRTLRGSGRKKKLLLACLRNTSGIGAILSRLRLLTADARQKKAADQTRDVVTQIEDLFDISEQVLAGDHVSHQLWKDISTHCLNTNLRKLIWREYISQVTSGKIVSAVAEAEDILKEKQVPQMATWLANGTEYATWLGLNLVNLMKENIAAEESVSSMTEICSKSLNLGYLDHIVRPIVAWVIENDSVDSFKRYLFKMKAFEQRKYLGAITTFIADEYLGSIIDVKDHVPIATSTIISSAAALVHSLVKDNEVLKDYLVAELVRPKTLVLDSLAARRYLIAAVAVDEEKLHNLFEKCIRLFGDSFYIKHTPILQQEVLGQTLVIAGGYVHRSQPMFLTMMAKSSYHVQGMSNRIGATSQRARFLGIAVGTAISKMVDKPELQLNFDLEGDESIEAEWFQRLTEVKDMIGIIKDLRLRDQRPIDARPSQKPAKASTKASPRPAITEIKGPRIVEILDDDDEDEDEDDDLVPYGKPDSDPEDETDDPTMINRNKPTAPVYIRDLLKGLRDSEDYDRHALALSTAAPLIRRKANFGSEVTDHIEELASVLLNLNDNFDIPEFNEQRQQALIAILLAKPAPMAQYFARSFFSGDYSLAQRIAMLTTLGIGARELAGLKDASTEALVPPKPAFPSEQLPPHLHKLYASQSSSNPVSRITSNLTQHLLSPLAAEAADTLTGPNILKVRTFSSRMEVEKRRSKPIPNALAQIVADNFFFPLTGRWWIATRSSKDSVYTSQHLLPQFLHTLALLLNAAGPNTLALPQMTREFWELLLSIRGMASNDKGVLSALLFAFLMLLEANEDKERLVNEQGKELLETQEWVRMVFSNLGAGSEEDEKIRVLAAGVVVRCQEVVDKYQRRLAGSMMDY
ncbi:telomere length regulation protein-domain-containing protein [Lophiotrema nucula]|uniref:Telomere length regulation protein-domain-containing protein n=1 Tax=Lophiotrema nucula TaxID=690887 RepID=A0A6A5ZJQ9_9PLEO|nr:telomere length regulation protein-domain-containing protein [Lophiotrema nucula]